MYTRVILVPYKKSSNSCKALQQELKELINKPVFRYTEDQLDKVLDNDLVIFWGCRDNPAANKLNFFQETSKEPLLNTPEWTLNREVATAWTNTTSVVCRTVLTGHSGTGIILVEKGGELVNAPLYVKYKKKKHEYRVHVFDGKVIDVAQKKKKHGLDQYNTQIRNLNGGWVYCRDNITITNQDDLFNQALLACNVCKLHFGAVDIIYNEHENKYYVLEVNTAPGLEGQTITKYCEAIQTFMSKQNDPT